VGEGEATRQESVDKNEFLEGEILKEAKLDQKRRKNQRTDWGRKGGKYSG